VQDPHNLVGVCHAADPGVPASINEAIAETSKNEADHEDGVGRMTCCDNIGDYVTDGADYGNAALAEVVVNSVIQQRG